MNLVQLVKELRQHGGTEMVFGISGNAIADMIERLEAEIRTLRNYVVAAQEEIASLESREVCTYPHDNVEECGYCQRDRLRVELRQTIAGHKVEWDLKNKHLDEIEDKCRRLTAQLAAMTAERDKLIVERDQGTIT